MVFSCKVPLINIQGDFLFAFIKFIFNFIESASYRF